MGSPSTARQSRPHSPHGEEAPRKATKSQHSQKKKNVLLPLGLPRQSVVKNLTCQCREHGLISGQRTKIPHDVEELRLQATTREFEASCVSGLRVHVLTFVSPKSLASQLQGQRWMQTRQNSASAPWHVTEVILSQERETEPLFSEVKFRSHH